MQRVSARDLRIVVDVACELGEIKDAETLQSGLLTQIRRLVRYDIASWNLVTLGDHGAQIGAVDPVDCRRPSDEELLGSLLHENPLVRQPAGAVGKFSDFMSLSQLHRLEIYDQVYGPLEVEHQIAFSLPAPESSIIGVALSRRRGDFSERDRALLELIFPFVGQAYARTVPPQNRPDPPPEVLERWRLTDREREILGLVATGQTNVQIARRLELSDRTVAKHLEHAYAKLAVPNRTAAVAKLSESYDATAAGSPGSA